MKELLKELGFEYSTGDLWYHPEHRVHIVVLKTTKKTDIVKLLILCGRIDKENEIKDVLGIT